MCTWCGLHPTECPLGRDPDELRQTGAQVIQCQHVEEGQDESARKPVADGPACVYQQWDGRGRNPSVPCRRRQGDHCRYVEHERGVDQSCVTLQGIVSHVIISQRGGAEDVVEARACQPAPRVKVKAVTRCGRSQAGLEPPRPTPFLIEDGHAGCRSEQARNAAHKVVDRRFVEGDTAACARSFGSARL